MTRTDKRKKLMRGWLWCCVLGVAAAIFLFSAQDGTVSSQTSNSIAKIIIAVIDPDFEALPAIEQEGIFAFVGKLVRKGAHFTEFAALGFCIRLLVGSYGLRWPTRTSWLAGTLYAGTDELHQLFVASRACMWQDVLLDSCGVLAGIMAAYASLVLLGRFRAWRSQ